MNILILGCSFGVPGQYPGCVVEDHTEYQLRKLGHRVYNCSQCAGSNINSLSRAKKFLAKEPIFRPEVLYYHGRIDGPTQTLNEPFDVDWIVWFHTELVRDKTDLVFENLPGENLTIRRVAELTYCRYFDFAKSLGAKLAVIGGAGPVYPSLFDFGRPDFCIPSWFNEILKLDLPQVQTLSRLDIVTEMQVGRANQLKVLEQHELILDALEASDDFPDNYHPGGRPHIELSKRLHQVFQGTQ